MRRKIMEKNKIFQGMWCLEEGCLTKIKRTRSLGGISVYIKLETSHIFGRKGFFDKNREEQYLWEESVSNKGIKRA
jgi:hypothetical protein